MSLKGFDKTFKKIEYINNQINKYEKELDKYRKSKILDIDSELIEIYYDTKQYEQGNDFSEKFEEFKKNFIIDNILIDNSSENTQEPTYQDSKEIKGERSKLKEYYKLKKNLEEKSTKNEVKKINELKSNKDYDIIDIQFKQNLLNLYKFQEELNIYNKLPISEKKAPNNFYKELDTKTIKLIELQKEYNNNKKILDSTLNMFKKYVLEYYDKIKLILDKYNKPISNSEYDNIKKKFNKIEIIIDTNNTVFKNTKKELDTKEKEIEEMKGNIQKNFNKANTSINELINEKKSEEEKYIKDINTSIEKFKTENVEKKENKIKEKALNVENKKKEIMKKIEKNLNQINREYFNNRYSNKTIEKIDMLHLFTIRDELYSRILLYEFLDFEDIDNLKKKELESEHSISSISHGGYFDSKELESTHSNSDNSMLFGGYLGSEEAFDNILQEDFTYNDNTEYLFCKESSDDHPGNRPMSFGGYLGSEEAFDKILQGITYKDNTKYLFYKGSSSNTSGNPSDNRPRTLS